MTRDIWPQTSSNYKSHLTRISFYEWTVWFSKFMEFIRIQTHWLLWNWYFSKWSQSVWIYCITSLEWTKIKILFLKSIFWNLTNLLTTKWSFYMHLDRFYPCNLFVKTLHNWSQTYFRNFPKSLISSLFKQKITKWLYASVSVLNSG